MRGDVCSTSKTAENKTAPAVERGARGPETPAKAALTSDNNGGGPGGPPRTGPSAGAAAKVRLGQSGRDGDGGGHIADGAASRGPQRRPRRRVAIMSRGHGNSDGHDGNPLWQKQPVHQGRQPCRERAGRREWNAAAASNSL